MNNNLLTKCLCCSGNKLEEILDLNKQPLANSYCEKNEVLDEYPLELNLCLECYHCQLSYSVDPDLMFKNYLYVSGTSQTLRNYFDWFANMCYTKNPDSRTVLDIACNDGSQLNSFKKLQYKTFGIDPAKNLYNMNTKNGHNVLCNYFNDGSCKKLKNQFGIKDFDIIVAQNVFAHNNNPFDFLTSCKKIMNDKTTLYIQTSQANMIEENQFDTIYHEHISFFNSQSMKTLVERSGLYLNDVFITPIHGNSYVFSIGKTSNLSKNVENRIVLESNLGLYDYQTYVCYALKCQKLRIELKETIDKYKNLGYKVIGYGAAAKGVVLLNYSKIDLDFVVDDNPLKHNLYMPGTNIQILDPKSLINIKHEKIIVLPLAWNFFDEIKKRTLDIIGNHTETDITFIKYFPNIEISK